MRAKHSISRYPLRLPFLANVHVALLVPLAKSNQNQKHFQTHESVPYYPFAIAALKGAVAVPNISCANTHQSKTKTNINQSAVPNASKNNSHQRQAFMAFKTQTTVAMQLGHGASVAGVGIHKGVNLCR